MNPYIIILYVAGLLFWVLSEPIKAALIKTDAVKTGKTKPIGNEKTGLTKPKTVNPEDVSNNDITLPDNDVDVIGNDMNKNDTLPSEPDVIEIVTPDEPEPDQLLTLPAMPTLTFQYFDTSTVRKPPMSDDLFNLLVNFQMTYFGGGHMHIVHVGTQRSPEDATGKYRDPNSFHLHIPADAIDVTKIYWNNKLMYIPRDKLSDRLRIQERIERLGGKCYDVNNPNVHHIHIQTHI